MGEVELSGAWNAWYLRNCRKNGEPSDNECLNRPFCACFTVAMNFLQLLFTLMDLTVW